MSREPASRPRAILDPLDRSREVLFVFRDLFRAARVSEATALVMLFVVGTSLGRHAGRRRPRLVGLVMVALGVVRSAIAIQLGG